MTSPKRPAKPVSFSEIISRAAMSGLVLDESPDKKEVATRDLLEQRTLEKDRLQAEVSHLEEQTNDLRHDRTLRKGYADKIFCFLVIFSLFSASIIVAQGVPNCPFKLPDNIVITLIGGTAASVIGLVGWVARGLFRAPRS